jgi:hypothetical protein
MKITICGSIAFHDEMKSVKGRLSGTVHQVKIPELALEAPKEFGGDTKINFAKHIEEKGGIDSFGKDHKIWDLKEAAIRDHYEKIEWADAILVINHEKRGIEGYIGGNTLIEIGIAFYLRKPIYILYAISSELSYKQEILGMKPIFLDGDINRIK